ncbi:hypothetical protein [Nocardioides sp. CER19]|uniref:hypothetical protein n=1 Tax=Nocardioides sp. CER19 TaxID=3038538 RepID=UPI00244BB33C|nr:hypothetical protein [Nocardioides sp. CER19]MDH2416549.1 hypothetical protein [Nocardioides sp. CER19]
MTRSRTRSGALAPALLLTLGLLVSAPTAQAAAPPVSVVGLPGLDPVVTGARQVFSIQAAVWSGEEHGNAIRSVDVRIARTPMTAARRSAWTYPAALQGAAASPPPGTDPDRPVLELPLSLAQGEVVCVSARTRDTDGNLGAWSEVSCLARFLDDSRLVRTGPLKRLRNRHFWGGHATGIRPGSPLVLRHVPAGSRVATLATAVPLNSGPDQVIVRVPGRQHMVTAFASGWTTGRRRIYSATTISAIRTARTGPVRLRSQDNSVSSPVEGIAVLPRWFDSLT